MSKSHVREMMRLLKHLFKDAAGAYPTLQGEFDKDIRRLELLAPHRGMHLFMVDMPAVCKHLDRCLSEGAYKLSGLPLTKRVSERVVIPRFMRGLYLRVFSEEGRLLSDYDVEAIFFLRQILLVGKKTVLSCSRQAVVREVDSFVALDASLPKPEQLWEMIGPTATTVREAYTGFSKSLLYKSRVADQPLKGVSTLLVVLDTVSSIISTTLGPYRPEDWRYRHGPGAISEVTGPTNKYSWRNWSQRLECVFALADAGYYNHGSWALMCRLGKVPRTCMEPVSRLIAVPKTLSKPRLIAAEPSEHQWCQQNIWHYLRTRTKESWIGEFVKFHDQTLNQELCVRGSRDGTLSTLDLSAASDRVTCHAVGQLFRSNPGLVLALQACRTLLLSQEISANSPNLVRLRKFSTMGSACTFPVESLMFLAITLSAVLVTRQLKPTLENIRSLVGSVAVFGDDIVVPSDSRELLVGALEVLHFKVNTDKSYWNGLFRESCGIDAYAGNVITPAYWRGPAGRGPESVASMVEVANHFQKRWLLNSSAYLASTIRWASIPTVGMDSGVCGFKSFVRPPSKARQRWNRDLQVMESRVGLLSSRQSKTPITDDSALLQFFTEDPLPSSNWEGGIAQRPKLKLRLGWVPTERLMCQT